MKIIRLFLVRAPGVALTAGILSMLVPPAARAQVPMGPIACGEVKNAFGPFDYRVTLPERRHLVEDFHFPPEVESLRAGRQSAGPGGDLDYTLRAFPNNPRALMSVVRYANKRNNDARGTFMKPFECYFDRALRFLPDDPTPHLLYGMYLRDRKRTEDARSQLDEAERLRGDLANFDFDYNLGLLYFDIGDYDKANIAAKRAYALGAPFPALKNKLQSKGRWSEE